MQRLKNLSRRSVLLSCLAALAVAITLAGIAWSQREPKWTIAEIQLGGQAISIALPAGWVRAPGPGLTFAPMRDAAAEGRVEARIQIRFESAPNDGFPALFERDLHRARLTCADADYQDQPIRSDLENLRSGTFMVLIECQRESRALLMIFKEMSRGMLTIERSWFSPDESRPDGADLKTWIEWADSITVAGAP